jgi:hypothetical protein
MNLSGGGPNPMNRGDLVGVTVMLPTIKVLLGVLLLVAVVAMYWLLVLAAIVVVLIVRAAPVAWREWQDERAVSARRRAGLIARADEQHRWAMADDPRGVYGEYTSAVYSIREALILCEPPEPPSGPPSRSEWLPTSRSVS